MDAKDKLKKQVETIMTRARDQADGLLIQFVREEMRAFASKLKSTSSIEYVDSMGVSEFVIRRVRQPDICVSFGNGYGAIYLDVTHYNDAVLEGFFSPLVELLGYIETINAMTGSCLPEIVVMGRRPVVF